jgi:5-methyltetrahydrofolate--homocysteine methyltransferase
MTEVDESIRNDLSEALRQGKAEDAEAVTRKALEGGIDPLELIQGVIVPTLTEVGQQFQDFHIFLPELLLAGEAAKRSSKLLEDAILAAGRQTTSLATVVIGTVENDVHDIGKNIVATMLSAHGFKVVDLGRNVAPAAFLEAATKEESSIIGMSSLMTTTRSAQRRTISLFAEVGEREKHRMIVGGGSANQQWADEIGADGYAPDAASAVELCKQLAQS